MKTCPKARRLQNTQHALKMALYFISHRTTSSTGPVLRHISPHVCINSSCLGCRRTLNVHRRRSFSRTFASSHPTLLMVSHDPLDVCPTCPVSATCGLPTLGKRDFGCSLRASFSFVRGVCVHVLRCRRDLC